MAEKRGKKKLTMDAEEIVYKRFVEGKPEMEALLEEEEIKMDVAEQIYKLRTGAGLTQRELAKRVGTTASVISRLESADYEGHSLAMLRRIAAALNQRVRVSFVPLERVGSS
jgi:ribosome-binding protein aMBF1 (putative translation factor)